MFRTKATLTAGFVGLALAGSVLASAPAEAGARTGTWRNGMVAGPFGAGYRGFGYRPAGFGYRPAAYGYRPAAYGYRPWGYGYRPYGYYRYRPNYGGAVAAGLIGGLALGALASSPAYSYPAYSYPAYSGYPAYYGTSYYAGPACYTVRRRFVDPWGRVFVRRMQVCE